MVIDIQSIKAFLKVSETGSFSRAAEQLFLTQPAVSKRIQAMEHTLDIKLFDRIGKSVQLTEAGHALIPGYHRILTEMDESLRIISNLHDSIRGVLSLATSHHIGLHRLPPVLREYSKQYPQVKLDINFMDSEEACKQVLHGDIEIAVVTLPEQADEHLTLVPVWSDPMACFVARDHELAKKKKVTKKDLIKLPAILPGTGTYTRNKIDQAFGDKYALNVLMETHYLETIKAMVQIGLGWALLPASMQDKSLKIINIPGLNINRQLGVVYHSARTRSNAANVMLALLEKCSN